MGPIDSRDYDECTHFDTDGNYHSHLIPKIDPLPHEHSPKCWCNPTPYYGMLTFDSTYVHHVMGVRG